MTFNLFLFYRDIIECIAISSNDFTRPEVMSSIQRRALAIALRSPSRVSAVNVGTFSGSA
jgi:hypothetical protein